jgi:hypothetical protein
MGPSHGDEFAPVLPNQTSDRPGEKGMLRLTKRHT